MSGQAGNPEAQRAWVVRVLGIILQNDAGPGNDVGPGVDDVELRKSLTERIREASLLAATLPDPLKASVLALARAAAETLKGTDLLAAEVAVEELETTYYHAKRDALLTEANKGATGRVRYRQLQIEWRDAQSRANEQLEALASAVVGDERVQDDPLYDDVVDAAADVTSLIPQFGVDLDNALDALDREPDQSKRPKLLADARKLVDEYAQMLDGAEGLSELQSLSDDEYGGISFYTDLKDVLKSLSKQLAIAS